MGTDTHLVRVDDHVSHAVHEHVFGATGGESTPGRWRDVGQRLFPLELTHQMTDTYYDVLDISPDATEEEIERAYRQKVKEHHPDRSDDPGADETFMRIRAAKETLLDPQARQRYDQAHDIQSEGSSGGIGRRIDRALIESILDGVARLQTVPRRTKRWFARLRPQAIGVSDVVRSPTVVRLAVAAVLCLAVVWTIRADNAVSPAAEFGVVLVSLCVSYAGYGILSPLPFEEPRNRAQFAPTPIAIWPVLVVHVLGLGLLWAATSSGTPSGGIFYAFMVVPYALVVCGGCLVLGVPVGMLLSWILPLSIDRLSEELRLGLVLGLLGSATVLFTSAGKGSALSAFVETVAPNRGTPWVPTLRAGPLHLGSLLNFGLALGMLVCLVGGIVGALWVLSVVPWRDRYDYGYHVRPTAWNLLAVVPLVTVVWMGLSGGAALSIPIGSTTVELLGPDVAGGLVVSPTLLVGAYLLRRRLEPRLQRR